MKERIKENETNSELETKEFLGKKLFVNEIKIDEYLL